jgi:hypothetical protein
MCFVCAEYTVCIVRTEYNVCILSTQYTVYIVCTTIAQQTQCGLNCFVCAWLSHCSDLFDNVYDMLQQLIENKHNLLIVF